jgi:predicted transposase/invertase (TIGR01784 family)
MGFCNLEKLANLNNTTITLIASHLPKSFLKLFHHNLIPIKKGLWKLEQKLFHIYFIEINQLDSKDYEVEYLYIFGNKEKLTTGSHNIHNFIKNKKMVEFLKQMYYIRYSNFEKEIPEDFPMPKVYEADITELVKPHYEKGLQEGLQKGLQEGLEKGEFKAKIETAKKMKKKGYSIKDICEITGLSKKDLKKYNII